MLAAASLAAAIALLVGQEQFRRLEAACSAAFVSLLRVFPAESLGTAVTFPDDGRYVGFSITASCTAALLLVPFLLITGVLLVAGRVPPSRAMATMGVFAAVVMVVNQLRLLAITLSIRGWGFQEGFDRSHVLLGSVVSTIGVAGGLLLFLKMVVPRRSGPDHA